MLEEENASVRGMQCNLDQWSHLETFSPLFHKWCEATCRHQVFDSLHLAE